MEFGSKYVYNYSDSEEETVSDEEFETGMAETCSFEAIVPTSAVASPPVELGAAAPQRPPARAATATSRSMTQDGGGSHPHSKLRKWMLSRSPPKAEDVSTTVRDMSARSTGSFGAPAGKRWRRADTNVVVIKFDQLTKPSNMHTGDAVSCQHCHAILSHISKLVDRDEDKVWQCEFCGEANIVDLLPDEVPKQSDVTYMIKPAALTTTSSCLGIEECLVIFCVDTSGSMCVSQEVKGRLNLRGSHADRYRSLNDTGENQWMPGQNRNVTYITRLQALQAAVDHQLEQLAKEHPSRKVALITFSSEVVVIGDGTMSPVTVTGDKLREYDELVQIASAVDIPARIQTSRADLGRKVFDLEEGGQTALGPAMLIAIMMASKVAGSKVIMCTDGLANIGLGNLDNMITEEYKAASDFYRKLGQTAKDNGVTVSVLTIAGTECKLVELGEVACATGGQVNIVDPLKLTQEFGNILANPVIASRVVATFLVHQGLYIRNEPELTSCVKRDVGNVTKDTEITFEYGVRRSGRDQHGKKQKAEVNPAAESSTATTEEASGDKDGAVAAEAAGTGTTSGARAVGGEGITSQCVVTDPLSELPFQIQIQYTDLDGAEAVRVLTQCQPVTKDRQQAETNINVPVVGCHAAQQSSALALEGRYTPSRLNAFMYQRLLYRNVGNDQELYGNYMLNVAPLEHHVRSAQMAEASSRGRSLTTYEDEEYNGPAEETSEARGGIGSRLSKFLFGKSSASAPPKPPAGLGRTMRRQHCTDSLSSEMYKRKQSSTSAFTSKSVPSTSVVSVPPRRLHSPPRYHSPPIAAEVVVPPDQVVVDDSRVCDDPPPCDAVEQNNVQPTEDPAP